MALLRITSGDSAGASFAIGAGSHRVGRADGNHLRLPDGSVSSSHCEVALDPSGNLFVRDLGSTNGTYIENQRVREALVLPGQRLRLGSLELVFENSLAAASHAPAVAMPASVNLPPPPVPGAPPAVRVSAAPHSNSAPPPPPAETGETATFVADACVNHPSVSAIAVCKKCGTRACNDCTKKQKVGRKVMHFCPRCGGACTDLGEVAKAAAVDATRTKTFGQAVGRAFGYPFRGNGIIILICGTIFFGFIDFFRLGLLSWSMRVLLWGYLFAFMQRIVVTSAQGEDDPPEFPEISDYHEDVVVPFRQLFLTLALSVAPAIAAFVYLGSLAGQFALILGALYFPMALLGVAMSDSYGALNPVFVLSSVVKCFGQYLAACFVFSGLMFLYYQVEFDSEIDIPIFGFFIFWFVFLVFLMIGMRILGMLYYLNKKKLGWGL
jgi:pSer/pThr/pTyr-binding forkhead associated (FHA) protein